MTYKETLEFLFSQLPMYQRQGTSAFKKDLGNITALCEFIGNPHNEVKCIHIAGTNGKGTVTHMLASILVEYGYKVGIYTSPHYRDFRERIKINNEFISRKEVVDFVDRIKPALRSIQASFFEMTVAMAFDHFSRRKVDYAVIETGLGGRLDSTNIITPVMSVITNISYDHEHMLGNTLTKIAGEKAGIIKQGVPVVIGSKQDETQYVFTTKAEECKAEIYFAADMMQVEEGDKDSEINVYDVNSKHSGKIDLELTFPGPFQTENLRTSLSAFEVFTNQSGLDWNSEKIKLAFANLRKNVKYIGRWEKLGEKPLIIADSAHNHGALSIVLTKLASLEYRQIHFVLGFVNDKRLDKILKLFPKNGNYYFSQAAIPRALPGIELKKQALIYGLKGRNYVSIKNALKAAKRRADSQDLIYVGGSIFVVAEII